MGHFTFLEHVTQADTAIEALGANPADLFETAARALAECSVDPTSLPVDREREVRLSAASLDLLLYDWLSEIIYRKDADREVFLRAEVTIEGEGPYRLTARLHGGTLDSETAVTRTDLKAVTFHHFSLEPVNDGWRARFVVDV